MAGICKTIKQEKEASNTKDKNTTTVQKNDKIDLLSSPTIFRSKGIEPHHVLEIGPAELLEDP